MVYDVWDSPESFRAFGEVLMPILADLGVDPGGAGCHASPPAGPDRPGRIAGPQKRFWCHWQKIGSCRRPGPDGVHPGERFPFGSGASFAGQPGEP
jgi:hypothetical protein